jgi:hypothetical protein
MNAEISLVVSHLPYYLFCILMMYESRAFRKRIEKLSKMVKNND